MNTDFKILNEELQKCNNEQVIKAGEGFFELCQDYYHLYLINKAMKPAEKILPKLDNFEYRVLVSLFEDAYEQYQHSDDTVKLPWIQVVDNEENINMIISEYFSNASDYFKKRMKLAIANTYKDDTRKKRYDNLKKAMRIIGDAYIIPKPTIEESVNNLITQETLDALATYLKTEPISFFFAITPIRRALFDGAMKSYSRENNSKHFKVTSGKSFTLLKQDIEEKYELYSEYIALQNLGN